MDTTILLDHAARPDPDAARGVFETVLVMCGQTKLWPRHRERLNASCLALYGVAPGADADAAVTRAAAGLELARLRIDVHPSPAGGLAIGVQTAPIDESIVVPAAVPTLALVRVAAGYGPHKLADRDWLEEIEALVGHETRPLLVGPAGMLLETTRANVLVVRDGELITPPLDGSILPGVMRGLLIEVARGAGVTVRQEPIAVETLKDADDVLLTGSIRLVEQVPLHDRPLHPDVAVELIAALPGSIGWPGALGRVEFRPR